MPQLVLREIQNINNEIEYQILNKYPNCVDISLEAHVPKDNQYGEKEEILNFFTKQLNDLQFFNKKWIEEAIDNFLENPIVNKNVQNNQIFLKTSEFRNSKQFVFGNISDEDVFESLLIDEDQRFIMIKNSLMDNVDDRFIIFDQHSDSDIQS